jgi:AcrR family transcriptional regulator
VTLPAAAVHAAPPVGLVGGDRRARLLGATVATVAERGYASATVVQIAAAAGVSAADFDRCFAGKEECFLAAYDLAVEWLEEWIRAALAAQREGWPGDVRRAVQATLDLLALDPRLACLCGAEVLFAGPRALERHRATVARLAALLRSGRDHCDWGGELPAGLEETILSGAIWWLARSARNGDAERLGEIAPDLTYFLLVPYLDAAEARRLADRR